MLSKKFIITAAFDRNDTQIINDLVIDHMDTCKELYVKLYFREMLNDCLVNNVFKLVFEDIGYNIVPLTLDDFYNAMKDMHSEGDNNDNNDSENNESE